MHAGAGIGGCRCGEKIALADASPAAAAGGGGDGGCAGTTTTFGIAGSTTLISTIAATPSSVAVMRATPVASGVTWPFGATVITAPCDERHSTDL